MTDRIFSANKFDVAIIGSGIAGLLLAAELNARGLKTVLCCKGRLEDSNTSWAQGGIAAVTGANASDSAEKHLADTLSAGAGLTDERIAGLVIDVGKTVIARLEEFGTYFDRHPNDKFELAREGGHCQPRVLHSKDASGRAISQALIAHLRSLSRLSVRENIFAYDLILQDGYCRGVRFLDPDDKPEELFADHIVLCTGGLGQVFSRTTNPSIATGDGIAMAWRAGARLADMEFVQFHPTALSLPGMPASLISEAVRGAGAQLLDSKGRRFAFDFHRDGELATRDVVSRAIFSVMQKENRSSVQLDMRPIGAKGILHEFPNIVRSCRAIGIDPLEMPIPVSPAAHYFMGGVLADEWGCTSIEGLYAIGECASIGLHGANRLASNSLLEGAAMAVRLAKFISGKVLPENLSRGKSGEYAGISSTRTIESTDQFKNEMWNVAGLVRDEGSLLRLIESSVRGRLRTVSLIRGAIEAANINLLGDLIARAACNRRESRGAHWRTDYPERDDANFGRRFFMSNEGNGWLELPAYITPSKIDVVRAVAV